MNFARHPKMPLRDDDDPNEAVPHRSNRLDLRVTDEQAFTQDQVMAARGYEPKPGGGWRVKDEGY